MLVPNALFVVGLWCAVVAVSVGASYLLTILVKEWRAGKLW